MAWHNNMRPTASAHALVLVPNREALIQDLGPLRSGRDMETDILPRSALICEADAHAGDPLVDADGQVFFAFKGNANGAVNLTRFHERCQCAAGRLAQSYPSVSYGRAAQEHLKPVARYDLQRFVFTAILDREALEAWAGEAVDGFMPPPIETPCSDPEVLNPVYSLPMDPIVHSHEDFLVWRMQDGTVLVKEGSDPICLYGPGDDELKAFADRVGLDAEHRFRIFGVEEPGEPIATP